MEQTTKKCNLTTKEMLQELPIKIDQLRYYLRNGSLPYTKYRNKFFVSRTDFDNFKVQFGF